LEVLEKGNQCLLLQVILDEPVSEKCNSQPTPCHEQGSFAVVDGDATPHRDRHLRPALASEPPGDGG
jgi:hypothetical protein